MIITNIKSISTTDTQNVELTFRPANTVPGPRTERKKYRLQQREKGESRKKRILTNIISFSPCNVNEENEMMMSII